MKNKFIGVFVLSCLSIASVYIGGGMLGTQPVQASTLVTTNETTKWMTVNRAAHTVTVKALADETNDNGGMNIDGYSHGAMNVEVPQGWTVKVVFQNHSSMMPHSLMIVPYSQKKLISGFTTAFKGASTPHSTQGIVKGVTELLSFKATKSGTYAMICGMPGHSAEGMWDTFTISNKIKSPEILITKSTQSKGTTSTSDTGSNTTTGSGDGW